MNSVSLQVINGTSSRQSAAGILAGDNNDDSSDESCTELLSMSSPSDDGSTSSKIQNGESSQTSHHAINGQGNKRTGHSVSSHVSSRGQETPRNKKRHRKNLEDLKDFESPEIFFEKVYQKHMSPKNYATLRTATSADRKPLVCTDDSPRRVSFPLEKANEGIKTLGAVKQVAKHLNYDSSDDELDLIASRSLASSSLLNGIHVTKSAPIDGETLKKQTTQQQTQEVGGKDGKRDNSYGTKSSHSDIKDYKGGETHSKLNDSRNDKSFHLSWINQPPGSGESDAFERYGIKWYWCKLCNNNKGRWRTHGTEQHEGKYDNCKRSSGSISSSSSSKKKITSLVDDMGTNADSAISNQTGKDRVHVRKRSLNALPRSSISYNSQQADDIPADASSNMHLDIPNCDPLHSVSDFSLEQSTHDISKAYSSPDSKCSNDVEEDEDERKLLKLIEESIQRDHRNAEVSKSDNTVAKESSAVGKERISSVEAGSAFSCINKKEVKLAIQNLGQIEKSILKKHNGSLTYAIMKSKKKDVSEYCYYLMRQFVIRNSSQGKRSEKTLSSDRCLVCCHCSEDIRNLQSSKTKKQIKIFKKHLFRCKRTPAPVKVALRTLEKLDDENREKNENTQELITCMNSVEQTGDKVNNQAAERSSVEMEEVSLSGRDLHEMYVFDRLKTLSSDHYPTLTFTAWNDKKDYLYDFKIFVGPSRIPNSGNGAFMKLLRVRVRKPRVDNVVPVTRCPLITNDSHGKPVMVFIGPNRVHNDFGPDNDDNYVEDNSIKFSSWDDGCGSIDIGSYGPFFSSDIKKESHYELKNFLFDFEPQGWSYGFHSSADGDDGENFVLDITNEYNGEPHLRARENIPMHVNETGHNKDLEVNVTPLEPEQGIHYYAHPKSPMAVGDTIELLVNYGEIYEEVRERKGYGKSLLGSDHVKSQRVKRNQCERVKVEDFIMSETAEELYDLLLSIRGTVDSVLASTQSCNMTSVPKSTCRQWTARFRIHWIETLFRKRINTLQSEMNNPLLFSNIMRLLQKMRYDGSSMAHHTMTSNPIIKKLALNETIEESVFLCSKEHQLLHPLDPSLWCAVAQDIVHAIGQKLAFELNTGICTEAKALEKIYMLTQDASTEIRHISQTKEKLMRIAFKKTDNPIVRKFLKEKGKNLREKFKPKLTYLSDKGANGKTKCLTYYIRYIEAEKTDEVVNKGIGLSNIDTQWYVLWQVVRVVHVMVTMCLPAIAGIYSLERLCTSAGVSVSDARIMLQRKMIEPYNEELYVSPYTVSGCQKAVKHETKYNSTSRVRQIRASGDRLRKMEERRMILLQECCQKDNFIPDVHRNVVRNRKSETFWKEMPAGPDFPQGWIIHAHKRKNGATGGRNIDYYWFTKNGKKLRSQVEVKKFIDALELAIGDEDVALGIFERKAVALAPVFPNAEVNATQK